MYVLYIRIEQPTPKIYIHYTYPKLSWLILANRDSFWQNKTLENHHRRLVKVDLIGQFDFVKNRIHTFELVVRSNEQDDKLENILTPKI